MTVRFLTLQQLRRRTVYRTLGGIAIATSLAAIAAGRRRALHDAAAREWMRGSSPSLQLASGAARAWAAEREAGLRLLATSASREPRIFSGPATLRPPVTAAALSQRLAGALSQLNQASGTPGRGFTELWIMAPSGALVSSATPRGPDALVRAAVVAAASSDSIIVVGPYPAAADRLDIAFIQPVTAKDGTPRAESATPSVIGVVVLATTLDPALAATLGITPVGPSRESTTLIARVRDSVYEYSLVARGPRGFHTRSWAATATPALERAALHQTMGAHAELGTSPAVATAIDDLPWALLRRADAETLYVAADAELVREGGAAIFVLSALVWLVFARRDRERMRNLAGIAASEARYRLLADYSTDIIARHALDGRVLYVSPAVKAVLGYSQGEMEGTYPLGLRHDGDLDSTQTALHRAFSIDEPVRVEHRVRHADGHYVWLETVGRAIRDPETGRVTEFISTSRDIADAKIAEEALRVSEAQYRLLFETNPMPMWAFDAETGQFLAVNDAAVAHYGYSRDEFLRMTIFDIREPEYANEVLTVDERRNGGTGELAGRHHRKKDGTPIEVDLTVHLLPVPGRPTRLVLVNDVTEKKKMAAAFRESSEFVRAILDSSPVAIIATDLELRVVQWNRAAERLFGWRASEIVGGRSPLVTDETQTSSAEALREALMHTSRLTGRREEMRRKDGTRVEVDLSLAVIHSATGAPAGFVGLAVDLTERTRLEAQLRQAQKMEAVGQLAGGIAHDFNNLLTVITTYAELLISDLPGDDATRADLIEIKGAGERAAALTRQLLAFSRQQVLEPRLIDLNVVIRGLEQMLRRVLPSTIHVVTSLDPDLGAVYADPGQIEQVLMNLIVNARDAMPDGGTLTIETANAELQHGVAALGHDARPGTYVKLAVSDTGCGMSHEVQEHIFEPFFTTKEIGKGTGLGLSTAHGIVVQSGGHLAVRSEPGVGTAFTMYLPRAAAETGDIPQDQVSAFERPGAEVVLLVEDEAAVRAAATRILERAGYTVLVAADGPEAVSLHTQHGAGIDVVLTDMIMPTMSGATLAMLLRKERPALPVVFMSGFAEDTMVTRGTDNGPVVLLHKPFTPETLTRKVREALRSSDRSFASYESELS